MTPPFCSIVKRDGATYLYLGRAETRGRVEGLWGGHWTLNRGDHMVVRLSNDEPNADAYDGIETSFIEFQVIVGRIEGILGQ